MLEERILVFSDKLGGNISVSSEGGRMICKNENRTVSDQNSMWKNGYWSNGPTWDHNAWEDRW